MAHFLRNRLPKLWQQLVKPAPHARDGSRQLLQEQRIAADKGILWHFPRQEYVDTVDIFADKGIGGKSTCQVRFEEAEVHGEKCGTAVFSGNISLEHPYEGLRTGYASMFQSVNVRAIPDLESFEGIELRVKADDRRYALNLIPENVYMDVIFQGYIISPRPNEWVTLQVRFRDLLATDGGFEKEIQTEIDPMTIGKLGFLIADSREGEFSLQIADARVIKSLEPPPKRIHPRLKRMQEQREKEKH